MKLTKTLLLAGAAVALITTSCASTKGAKMDMTSAKIASGEAKYTFALAENVTRTKVTFRNHFGIEIAGDLYTPKNAASSGNAAVAVSGPFGAVKEQSSGLYANEMAKRGFIALAFDPSFTGESGGEPRFMNSPDINTEDFMAAGMALNTAAIDTRIKATVASTMYDMSRVTTNGYFDSANTADARNEARKRLMAQRTQDFKAVEAGGTYARVGGFPDAVPDEAPQFVKDYFAYYRTPRGYHERSANSTKGWSIQAETSLMNTKLLAFSSEIRSPVLMLHGEKAHSRYFSEDAYKNMTEGSPFAANKELMIIPNASHCDLYDGGDGNYIPWDKIESFLKANLK